LAELLVISVVVGGVGGTYTRVTHGKANNAFFTFFFGVFSRTCAPFRLVAPFVLFFVPSSNYDLAGALHGFLAALGATLGAGNATDHRPSLHRSPIQTRCQQRLVINGSTILRRTVELWEGLRTCSTSGATTGKHLPAVQQMAYDLLAIPVMSSEVERAFSGAKNTLNDKRTSWALQSSKQPSSRSTG